MHYLSLFYLLLGKYFFVLGILFLIDIILFFIRQKKRQTSTLSPGQKIRFILKGLGTIPFFFGYLLFVFTSEEPSLFQDLFDGIQDLCVLLAPNALIGYLLYKTMKKRKEHGQKVPSSYTIQSEPFLLGLFFAMLPLTGGFLLFSLSRREVWWVCLVFLILFLFNLLGTLNVGLWKVEVNGTEILYRSTFGRVRTYSFSEITKGAYKKSGAFRVYAGDKRIFTFDDNMDFTLFLQQMEQRHILILSAYEISLQKQRKKEQNQKKKRLEQIRRQKMQTAKKINRIHWKEYPNVYRIFRRTLFFWHVKAAGTALFCLFLGGAFIQSFREGFSHATILLGFLTLIAGLGSFLYFLGQYRELASSDFLQLERALQTIRKTIQNQFFLTESTIIILHDFSISAYDCHKLKQIYFSDDRERGNIYQNGVIHFVTKDGQEETLPLRTDCSKFIRAVRSCYPQIKLPKIPLLFQRIDESSWKSSRNRS